MPNLHFGRNPSVRSLERYDCIPPGGGRFDLPDHLLPDCWARKSTGTTDVMGRMRWDHPSLTIRTGLFKPEKGQYLHPQWHPTNQALRVNLPITHQEAALLQTFPPNSCGAVRKIEIAKWIGNAVPPLPRRPSPTPFWSVSSSTQTTASSNGCTADSPRPTMGAQFAVDSHQSPAKREARGQRLNHAIVSRPDTTRQQTARHAGTAYPAVGLGICWPFLAICILLRHPPRIRGSLCRKPHNDCTSVCRRPG